MKLKVSLQKKTGRICRNVKWIVYFRIDIIVQLLEQAIDKKEP
jgi:hypothetical protein